MSIRVLVVDDSALVRQMLTQLLAAEGDIVVVGAAEDPMVAREMIRELSPDVLTLDVEMPNMNGLDFLERLMRLRPLPVVMVSTLTRRGADASLLALELGAVEVVGKPSADLEGSLGTFGRVLRDKVRAAARARVRGAAEPAAPMRLVTAAAPEGALIAIGASTGGVEAIRSVLAALPPDCPPIAITQHMPPGFTERFAARLDEVTRLSVCEAADDMVLEPGHAYVAPGDRHLLIQRARGRYVCRLSSSEERSGHRPSVDMMFESVANAAESRAAGAILTGMGRDGAEGLLAMRLAGAHTVGQSAASALVYGMPRVAFEIGAVVEQAALDAIPSRLVAALGRRPASGEPAHLEGRPVRDLASRDATSIHRQGLQR